MCACLCAYVYVFTDDRPHWVSVIQHGIVAQKVVLKYISIHIFTCMCVLTVCICTYIQREDRLKRRMYTHLCTHAGL